MLIYKLIYKLIILKPNSEVKLAQLLTEAESLHKQTHFIQPSQDLG